MKKIVIGLLFVIGCIVLFLNFSQLKKTFSSENNQSMLIIGHRGACGYEPENTLVSFSRALDMGVDMIELDVYVCKTGQLVVMHDDTVDRTTNGHGKVVEMPFEELRSLRTEKNQQIPTLQEVIALLDRRVPIDIELKGPGTAKPVAQLVNAYLAQGWQEKDFVISSFDHDQLLEFKKLCPNIKTGILFDPECMPENIAACAKKYAADFIGLDLEIVTHNFVTASHQAGFPVFVWTVNNKQDADRMRSLGVNGIFTNYPDEV